MNTVEDAWAMAEMDRPMTMAERIAEAERLSRELDRILGAGTPGNLLRTHEQLKRVMGKYYFGPKDWATHLKVKGVELPQIPEWLTPELLQSADEFETSKTVAETHCLLVIPSGLSPLKLAAKVEAAWPPNSGKPYYNLNNWAGQDFAKKESPDASLVLIRRDFLPGSQKMTDAQQLEHLKEHPEYETASLLSLQSMLLLNFLKNDRERLFEQSWGRCEEHWGSGRRSGCGGFTAGGVSVGDVGGSQDSDLGRAACRKS